MQTNSDVNSSANTQSPEIDEHLDDGTEWYGPRNQFYPHRIVYALLSAPVKAILNTILGMIQFVLHPIRSLEDIYYGCRHLGEVFRGIKQRSKKSLRKNGIVFTGVSLACMVILPGGGTFGHISGLTKDVHELRTSKDFRKSR